MIKELMDKLHIHDSVEEKSTTKEEPAAQPAAPPVQPAVPEIMVNKPTIPRIPKPKMPKIQESVNTGGIHMNDGIIIDLGDGISLNVPIKRRMTLYEFLKVAEKVKALEMLAEEERRGF